MRIVAGTWRGRKLLGPVGTNTRPILDRVKASLFDVLGSYFDCPGRIPAQPVLDLFCGTGSLGLEALSRGATHCTFVDRDSSAIHRLRSNIERLGAADRSTVLHDDALGADFRPTVHGAYRLVFVDPPYSQSRGVGPTGLIARLFERFVRDEPLCADALIVCRWEADAVPGPQPGPYHQVDLRRYGRMALALYRQAPTNAETVDEAPGSS